MRGLAWVAPAAIGGGIGLVLALGLTSDDGDPKPAAGSVAPPPAAAAATVESGASGFARSTIDAALLRTYLATGRELELDWAVLAAVDQLLGGPDGTARDTERVSALAYTLLGVAGAPADYRGAVAVAGGDAIADRALRLAERYRDEDVEQVPATSAPLRAPVQGPVLAAFGQIYGALHDGVDIAADTGTPIRAPAPGAVLSTGSSPIYGEYTCLLHRAPDGIAHVRSFSTCYGNQSEIRAVAGRTVREGDVIGLVGCSGPCLRPHLHFQVRLGAGPTAPVTDPAPFLGGDLDSIAGGRPLEPAGQ